MPAGPWGCSELRRAKPVLPAPGDTARVIRRLRAGGKQDVMSTAAMHDVQGLVVVSGRDASGSPVIAVSGELDFWTLDEFDAALKSALERFPTRITLDLSGLRFIDSSGIGVLAAAMGSGIPIRLRRPTPAVRRVLEFTGLAGHLPIVR